MTTRKLRKRFRQLCILEAFGNATAAEIEKLERYQRLFREKPTPREKMIRARYEFAGRMALKVARCVCVLGIPPDPRNYDLLKKARDATFG